MASIKTLKCPCWLVCIVALSVLASYVECDGNPVVSIKNGKVRGAYVSNGKVSAFLGIPYGAPTTNENRFKKPQPVKDWEGTYDATSKAPICMQISADSIPWVPKAERSEDCLFLNVWNPTVQAHSLKGSPQKLPVMVWIHGGGFYAGWSGEDFYDGATIAELGNVVVVSMNYRLGAFGFLTSATKDAPGNVGMHDQVLALKWVKENIENFGGDPNSITLFGESAGAVSVGLHIVSPLSKNLFHRAILQSGSPYHPQLASSVAVAKFKSNMVATAVGCADEKINLETDPEGVIKCLRENEPEVLAKAEAKLLNGQPLFFIPNFGDDFLPIDPITAVDSGKINNVPVFIGTNKDEGAIFLSLLLPKYFNATHAPVLNDLQGKAFIAGLFQMSVNPAPTAVADFYMKNVDPNDSEAIVRQVHHSFGDNIFVCPVTFFAEKMPEVYSYRFTHRPSNTLWGEWMGTTHFDEVPFVFGLPHKFPQIYTEEEGKFSKDIIDQWTTFARTGMPCGAEDSNVWPKYTPTTHCYKELYPNSLTVGHGPRLEACEFWREYFVSKQ